MVLYNNKIKKPAILYFTHLKLSHEHMKTTHVSIKGHPSREENSPNAANNPLSIHFELMTSKLEPYRECVLQKLFTSNHTMPEIHCEFSKSPPYESLFNRTIVFKTNTSSKGLYTNFLFVCFFILFCF